MGLRGRMKKLYKLSCILNKRKSGSLNLSCEKHIALKEKRNNYDWCDTCIYSFSKKE